jgi:hypothetical protein
MKAEGEGETMENSFNDVIEAFNNLKAKFQAGDISRQQFIDEMKKLRIKDDQGHFWMIGAQTGKWYFFDGKDWIQAEPPSQKEKKAICVYCGFENKLEAAVCARCGGNFGSERSTCPKCGAKLQKPLMTCPNCRTTSFGKEIFRETGTIDQGQIINIRAKKGIFALRSILLSSLFLLGGVLGVLIGVVAGVFAGATGYFSKYLTFLPASLANLQGKLFGAIIDGLLGGAIGFLVFGVLAFLKGVILNFILSLIGGLKLNLQISAPEQKKEMMNEGSEDRESDPEASCASRKFLG